MKRTVSWFLVCGLGVLAACQKPSPPQPAPPSRPAAEKASRAAMQAPTVRAIPIKWDTLGAPVPIELSDTFQPVRVILDLSGLAAESGRIVAPSVLFESASGDGDRGWRVTMAVLGRYTGEGSLMSHVHEAILLPELLVVDVLTQGMLELFAFRHKKNHGLAEFFGDPSSAYRYRYPFKQEDALGRMPRTTELAVRLGVTFDPREPTAPLHEILLLPRRSDASFRLVVTLRQVDRPPPPTSPQPVDDRQNGLRTPAADAVVTVIRAVLPAAPPGEALPTLLRDPQPQPLLQVAAVERSTSRYAQEQLRLLCELDPTECTEAPGPWIRPLPMIAPPERLATPAESLAARPAWADPKEYTPIPKRREADELRALLPQRQTAGPLRDATLLCQGSADTNRAESAKVTLGSLPTVSVPVQQDGFVVPLVSVAEGGNVSVELVGRTAGFLIFRGTPYTMTTLTGRLTGTLPLILRGPQSAEVRCDSLAPEVTAPLVGKRLRGSWRELQELTLGPNPVDHGTLSRTEVPILINARDSIRVAASLIGWSDPRLRPHLQRLAYLEDLLRSQTRAYIAAQRQNPSPPPELFRVNLPGLSGRIVGQRCGAAAQTGHPWRPLAGRCVLDLEIRNEDTKDVACSGTAIACGWELQRVVYPDGALGAVTVVGRDDLDARAAGQPRALAPGAKTRVVVAFGPRATPAPRRGDEKPALLQIGPSFATFALAIPAVAR